MTNPNRKPETIEELREYLASNQDEGKINGEQIVPTGTTEFRSGYVPGDVYDFALLRGAPFGYTKSDIGHSALERFVTSPVIASAESKLITAPQLVTGAGSLSGEGSGKGSEFRAYIPNGLYGLVQETRERLEYSRAETMTVALCLFIFDPGIEAIYQRYVRALAAKHGVSIADIEHKIFGARRYQARLKRLELSEKAGHLITDRKLAT